MMSHWQTPVRLFRTLLLGCLALGLLTGCNVRRFAIDQVADAISGTATTFASDEDPELVRDALPFSLKLVESLLVETPRHRGLLLTACSGFTQYGFAFVQQEADETESRDLAAATALRDRARKLYLRARGYGLRGLDVAHPGFSKQIQKDPLRTVAQARKADVPLLYWTAAAWGAAISISKDRPDLIADQLLVEAMLDRALQLDESFDAGAVHAMLVTYEPARQGAKEPVADRVRKHFERAVQLSGGQAAAPFVSLAESVCIQQQKRKEFESLLKQALAIDVNARPHIRLENVIYQRRARWLLSRTDDLFVE